MKKFNSLEGIFECLDCDKYDMQYIKNEIDEYLESNGSEIVESFEVEPECNGVKIDIDNKKYEIYVLSKQNEDDEFDTMYLLEEI